MKASLLEVPVCSVHITPKQHHDHVRLFPSKWGQPSSMTEKSRKFHQKN